MGKLYNLKIDAYSHIVPLKYKEALAKLALQEVDQKIAPHAALYDMDERFRVMDKYEGLVQVLTPAWPPVEDIAGPAKAAELAKLQNDGIAELVRKYPDRFVAAIASLPMNNMDAALKEVDRVINDLSFRGVLIHTPIQDKPLDLPEFLPLYEKMAHYSLPIFIHPMRGVDYPDYRTESQSKYRACNMFGWPYETTVAMTRLVFSGVLEKYPNIKFITHHCGGMVPYYEQRIILFQDGWERRGVGFTKGLTKAPIDYYRMFYNDTALYGNPGGLMCGYRFSGADHLLFGTDAPLGDSQDGVRNYRQTINAIEEMEITDAERKMIYEDNARRLLRLPI
jgi:uncharacterized protein